ncbi:MAG: hypothetical protein KBD21_01470 [Candidatus Pacebacteria bacterium]|nr:hypothetical protein [Candidatus Paceibacterota bacterium]
MSLLRERHCSAFDGVRVSWKVARADDAILEHRVPLRAFDGVVRVRPARPLCLPVARTSVMSPYGALRNLLAGIHGVVRVPRLISHTFVVS